MGNKKSKCKNKNIYFSNGLSLDNVLDHISKQDYYGYNKLLMPLMRSYEYLNYKGNDINKESDKLLYKLYKKGGGIHIKPENRGKFTATMKRTGKTAEQLAHSKNPLTRKRAIFAINSRKWKHLFGGTFKGIATDNSLMVSKDKGANKSKPKLIRKIQK